jgi:hypothetical protein
MMVMALARVPVLTALLAIPGAAAVLRGTDSRETFVNRRRR